MQVLPTAAPSPSHETIFLARYERLRGWALQLTGNNRELADDLVHDAFIQFTLARPDLDRIQNPDAYLYGVLRNLHLSHVRRVTRSRLEPLSILDYDSVEVGLRTVHLPDQIHVQDQLRRACHYACIRKETSKVASVLILRFFHGYYPSEIVQVFRVSRQAVREQMRIARAEAKLSIENPTALSFMGDSNLEPFRPRSAHSTDEFLRELRQMIFRSRRGECLSRERLHAFERAAEAPAMDSQSLAHVVSCPTCLDAINTLLGLPLLADRYPTDTLDKDTNKKGGSGGGTPPGASMNDTIGRLRRRAREAFEHDPQELCVSVNGYLRGSQKISSELSELTLSLKGEEEIDFIEVFSEQEVRLLLVAAEGPPPDGAGEQHARVELSDHRTLELTLRYRSPWPTLQVVYHDPTLKAATRAELGEGSEATAPSHRSAPERGAPAGDRLFEMLGRFGGWLDDRSFWLRPGVVTTALSVVLVAALFLGLWRAQVPTVTAAELLGRSASVEEALIAQTTHAVHRTVTIEERDLRSGQTVARRKVDLWQSPAGGTRVRRLYDERGRLVAGEWVRADGSRTLYHTGAPPQEGAAGVLESHAPLDLDAVSRLEPSAREFTALVGHLDAARVEERPDVYVVSLQGDTASRARGLVGAAVVLAKADLRTVEQTLVVEREGSAREYRLVEGTFERHSKETVRPATFEPEAELLGSTSSRGESPKGEDPTAAPEPDPAIPPTAVATAELEVEVLAHLDRIEALFGEQVSLARTPEGRLRVEAIVDTEARKAELERALGPVRSNPAVTIQIETATEAARRQAERAKAPARVVASTVEVEAGRALAADAELRQHFSRKGLDGAALEDEIRNYATSTMARSRRARRHALALKKIVERFSPDEARALDDEARRKLSAMLREHARAVEQEMTALERELAPMFSPGALEHVAAGEIGSYADLARAATQLFELVSTSNESVSRSFAITTGSQQAAPVKAPQFWRALGGAKTLAAKVQRYTQP